MATELQNLNQATEVYSASETDLAINGSLSNALLSGGVSWDSGLTFDVTPLSYRIDGIVYNTAATQVTLAAADPTFDRIDVIVGNTLSAVAVITGTPSADPVKPEVDLATQIEVTFIKVAAGATTPDIVVEDIYLEDTEWGTSTNSPARIDLASTNDPYAGAVSIEGTLVVTGDRVDFVKGSTYNVNTTSVLELRIKLKAAANNADRIRLRMRNNGANVGVNVDIRNGRYGYVASNTADYQAISIPIGDFKAGTEIDALRITANNIATNIGFFLDQVRIIEGFGISVGIDAGDVTYTPSTPADWPIVPDDVAEALDALAASGGGGLTFEDEGSTVTGGPHTTLNVTGAATVLDTGGGEATLNIPGTPLGSAGGDLAGTYPNPTVGTNKITNAKAAQMAANTIKGNNTAGLANQTDIAMGASTFLARLAAGNIVAATATQATALLNAFTSALKGLVPASGGGTTNFLRADGTWGIPPSAGLTSFSVQATSTVTTSSDTDVVLTGMTLTPGAGDYLVMFNTVFEIDSNIDRDNHFTVYVNGVAVAASVRHIETTDAAFSHVTTIICKVSGVGAGQAIDIRWRTENTGDVLTANEKTLNLIKL